MYKLLFCLKNKIEMKSMIFLPEGIQIKQKLSRNFTCPFVYHVIFLFRLYLGLHVSNVQLHFRKKYVQKIHTEETIGKIYELFKLKMYTKAIFDKESDIIHFIHRLLLGGFVTVAVYKSLSAYYCGCEFRLELVLNR